MLIHRKTLAFLLLAAISLAVNMCAFSMEARAFSGKESSAMEHAQHSREKLQATPSHGDHSCKASVVLCGDHEQSDSTPCIVKCGNQGFEDVSVKKTLPEVGKLSVSIMEGDTPVLVSRGELFFPDPGPPLSSYERLLSVSKKE